MLGKHFNVDQGLSMMTETYKHFISKALLLLTYMLGALLRQKQCCEQLQQSPEYGFHTIGVVHTPDTQINITGHTHIENRQVVISIIEG